MRIGIYLHPLREGGGRYLLNLVPALARLDGRDEFHVYAEQPIASTLKELPVHLHFLPSNSETAWERTQTELPRRLSQHRIDVFHCHFHQLPVIAPCRTVVTIHDAIPLLASKRTLPSHRRRISQEQLLAAMRLADHVIVSSRYTARQFVGRFRISPDRITIIHLGSPDRFHPIPKEKAAWTTEKLFGIKRPFFLSVGTLIPRKNYPLLIQAFRKELKKTHDLVIVGMLSWWGRRVLRLIRDDPTIHYVGPIPDRDLLYLYGAAECLVYPSEMEGFGLPLLEAMTCGTPVIAARSSSIPEVVGDAGLLVEPGSVGSLAGAMRRIVENKWLWQKLSQRGLERASGFQWKETALKTLEVYRKVANGTAYQGTS